MRDAPAIAAQMEKEGKVFAAQLKSPEAREAFAALRPETRARFLEGGLGARGRRRCEGETMSLSGKKTLFVTGASRGIGAWPSRLRARPATAPMSPSPPRPPEPHPKTARHHLYGPRRGDRGGGRQGAAADSSTSATRPSVMAAVDQTVAPLRRHRHLRPTTPRPFP